MAIKKSIELISGISLPDAYHKVISANMIRNGKDNRMLFEVAVYKDNTARQTDKSPVMTFVIPVTNVDETHHSLDDYFSVTVLDGQGVNPIKQCYEYLKTQVVRGIDYTKDVSDV